MNIRLPDQINMENAMESLVDVRGGQLFVKKWEPSKTYHETPILLLHDSLGCIGTWKNFPTQLAEISGRSVIAYDRLGFGRSTERLALPTNHFIEEEAEIFLPEILKAFRLKRVCLFGHSIGGVMALLSASRLGTICEAVISESAQAVLEDRTRQGMKQAFEAFKDPANFAKLEKYHGKRTRWVLDAWFRGWLSGEFDNWSLHKDLVKLRCPILVIHGAEDEYGSIKSAEMICSSAGGPCEKLIIPDCGHVPHRERPDLVLKTVAKYLEN